MSSQIKINGKNYDIVDILSGITAVDCAVCRSHKTGSGNGERKIYLPGNVQEKYKFFDDFSKDIKGFLCKENLERYLLESKKEFSKPSQEYKNKSGLKKEYKELKKRIDAFPDELFFNVKKADVTHTGLYINQASGKKIDKNWNILGDLAFPQKSHFSIFKLKKDGEILYYFKITFGVIKDYDADNDEEYENELKKINNSKLKPAEKETVVLARVGQGKFREKLLEESSICPFTLIDNEHLLVASHIKPWKKSTLTEKRDPKNGFILSATYDKLFDRGYISFNNDKTLIISPWLSQYNRDRLGITEGMIIEQLPEIGKKRAYYLEYHRKFVLKKMEEL